MDGRQGGGFGHVGASAVPGDTGERAAAGRDSTIPVDTILRDERDDVVDGESLGDEEDEGRGDTR
jgi:hypothetical protein